PLVDLDRTMDTFHGLLDRRCNPRSPFHAARELNSLLFGDPAAWEASDVEIAGLGGWHVRQLRAEGRTLWLLVPSVHAVIDQASGDGKVVEAPAGPLRLLRLRDATAMTLLPGESLADRLAQDGPSVVWPLK
ncbi:MAG: hypothetical protein AB7K36_28695, partial [Chloroflexota bacterium]